MKAENNGISSKWLIKGFDGICIGSDKNFYKLPFKSGSNYYGIRKLKEQPGNRFKINGKWISKRQLKNKVYLNPNPEILIQNESDCPF